MATKKAFERRHRGRSSFWRKKKRLEKLLSTSIKSKRVSLIDLKASQRKPILVKRHHLWFSKLDLYEHTHTHKPARANAKKNELKLLSLLKKLTKRKNRWFIKLFIVRVFVSLINLKNIKNRRLLYKGKTNLKKNKWD